MHDFFIFCVSSQTLMHNKFTLKRFTNKIYAQPIQNINVTAIFLISEIIIIKNDL